MPVIAGIAYLSIAEFGLSGSAIVAAIFVIWIMWNWI